MCVCSPLVCTQIAKPGIRSILSRKSYCHPCSSLTPLVLLGHGVKGRAVVEPLDLAGVEGVGEGDVEGGVAVGGVDAESHGLANLELGAEKVDLVVGLDLLVVLGVGEGEGKHTLLLQVGLVDTGERASDDGRAAQVPGLERSVLTGRTLAVVPV